MSDKLTLRQAQVFSAYTGITCCKFNHVHEYIEEVMDRPVFTHEMGSEALSGIFKEKKVRRFTPRQPA